MAHLEKNIVKGCLVLIDTSLWGLPALSVHVNVGATLLPVFATIIFPPPLSGRPSNPRSCCSQAENQKALGTELSTTGLAQEINVQLGINYTSLIPADRS